MGGRTCSSSRVQVCCLPLPTMLAMKAVKAMKAAMKTAMKKVMKAKKKSKIAKGKRSKSVVFRGSKEKTSGGLTASQLMKNKRGKIVSKAASAAKKKAWEGSRLAVWVKAVQTARKELDVKGFVGINGKTALGKTLYAKAKAIYTAA